MDIKESLEEFNVIFSVPFPGGASINLFGQEIRSFDINETVIVSWAVMVVLIAGSLFLTRKLRAVPRGSQVFLEAAVEFCNKFSKDQFGRRAGVYGPYLGAVFLFILLANLAPVISPLAISILGVEPPFTIKPPTRDINFTAAAAVMSILIVFVGGLRARGPAGWLKNLLHPVPMMLPFNLLEYIIRPLSLCLRLFGNILGGFIIMFLVEHALPVPVIIPAALSVYFDFFDGLIQAVVFTFLTALFTAEAVNTDHGV